MKLQVIQLEDHDDALSVRDRLSFTQADRVMLVWPPNTVILCRKLDLVLIQREAARRHAKLAIVTRDPGVIDNAAELHISVFDSVEAGQTARWQRPLNKVFIDRSDRPKETPDAYELRLVASRLNRLTPQQRRVRQIARQIVVFTLVLLIGVVTYLIVPSANVIVTPAQDQLSVTVPVIADTTLPTLDVEGGKIPATIDVIETQIDANIKTSGSKDVPATLASGIVTLTNQTNTQVFVPSGTIVSSIGDHAVLFRTTNEVTIGAGVGKTANVAIEATQDYAGPIANIQANLITNIAGALGKSVSVRNPDATQGGTLRQQGVVTQEDQQTLLTLAREKLRQTALSQFDGSKTPSQFIVPGSIKIIEERPSWTTYSAFIGDPADTLTLRLRGRVQAVIIDTQQARQVVFARLVKNVANGREVSPDSVSYTDPILQAADDKGNIAFIMSATANVAVSINPDAVRQKLAGVSVGDAFEILQRSWLLDPLHSPDIQVSPAILGRLPLLGFRINVVIK